MTVTASDRLGAMQRHQTLSGYVLTLLFYTAALALGSVWGGFQPGFAGAISIIAAPPLVLGIVSSGWGRVGIPLSMWTLSALAFSIVWPSPGDLGRVGVFTLTLVLYWPVIVAAVAVGKLARTRITALRR